MDFATWFAFTLACLIFSSSPGVGILFTVNNALTKNVKYTVVSIVGLEVSLSIYLLLVAFGLGVLVSASALIFNSIKWFGVVYLIFLGVQKIRTPLCFSNDVATEEVVGYKKAFISGICVNLSNPKSIIFLAALLPQFVEASLPQPLQYIILGSTMICIDILFHALYGIFAKNLRQKFSKDSFSGYVNRVFGLIYIGAGLLIGRANN